MSTLGEQQGARVNELNNGVVQQGVPEKYLQKAVVTLPSGNVTNFFVHKKSKGNVLTDLVSEHEGLLEKDYFGLNYVDHFGEKTWLYPDKRIAKQLNKEPWNFTLRVKFYAPEPSVLADDLTRYLLYLQVRKDVYDETLPTSYPTKILLAAIVMQAETGDFETTEQSPEEYDQFVRNARLVPSVDQEFLAKVREAHKEQKGLTTQEAHLKYLDAAKALAKYGYTFFQGKDVKNGNVTIGIHAHGITVYKDQVQIHKFLWQSIEKIQYSSNKFSILLKPGELDEKKQVTVRYSMPDYYTAKRLYRTAVEHHTFFRLIRPEDPPKSGLLSRVGSEHFRYQGRTYFQAKMASQMFDNPTTTVQRTPSGRQVSRSVDDLAIQRSFPASPLHYADESTHQATSPEKSKSYSLSSKHKDERTPLSVVVHETNEAYPGSKRSSTSSASIVSPFSGEYIVSSRPYTPRDEATTSPYEDVVFPLAISPSERQRNVRTPTKSAASTSQRNSRVRFFDGGPVTPDDGSAVAMAPAGKPGKRTAKRRLFGPVNDDHTAFAPVDDLYRSPEIVNVPLDSKVSVYDRGWYTATLPSTSAQQSVPFFVCCKPTKAVRREFDILRDFDNGIIDQSNLHKRSELDSYPLRYYSSVYHSGLPPTKRRKWVTSKDEDVIPADRLNPEYYVFGSERDYSPERFERVTEAETVPLRQVSRVYWHGGTSKPNTKVVEVAPESRIVRTTTTQQRTAPSTSTETVERSFVEHDLPVHEVKTTTVERSGQPGDEYTITTTRIETTTILESEAQPSTSEEYVPPPQNKTVVKERVSSSRYPVITEAYNGPIDVIPKSRDLDLLPIKRFANVYHPGISEERVTPITWIRKQKTSLLDRRRDSNRPTISETSESSFPSKSTHHEKIVSRKRLHSLSQHYPVIGEAYEGPVNTISPTIEAESANLFDCVSFASVDEAGPSESPTDKKVSRSLKYSLPRCVCGWCGPQERHLIEDQYPYDVEPYTGPVENLTRDGQLSHAELETCVNFQVEEEPERVEEEPKKIHVVQEIPTINIHEEPSLHESDTDEDVPAISGVEYDMSINMHKPNDAAYAECVIEIPSPQINVTFESRSEEVHEHRSTVATETTIIREKVESNIPDYDIENVEPVRSSAVIERRPSSPVPTEPQPIHVIDYELSRIDSRRVKFDPETSKSAHPRAELITEEVSYPVHEPLSQQRRPASNEGCGLFCGTNKKAIQDDPYDVTGEHHVTTKDSPSTLSKNYPVIGEPFDGEYADLSHQPEAEFTDLFDTISFVSSSEDSGIGGETTAQRPKPKKTGLKCLWCGPSKSQRKTPEESLKAVNVHEQQVQRRNVIKKAETYALSEHYPVAQAYSGEVVSLNKAELAPEANLFDLIDFIPSESETSSSKDLKPKKSGLKCLWCGFTKSRGVQTDLTQRRSNGKCVPLNCLAKKSNESRYPIDVEPYVGPVFELERPAEAPSANLFDTISFATDDEDHVSLQLHNNGDLRRASSEAHEPAPVVNVPEVRRESTSDPTAKPRILASTENVDMVFVHKLHSNEPIASTSSVAEPSTQQQTVEDVHVAEAQNVALYKHMDDVVDLAVPSTSHEVEEPFVAARTPTPPTERQVAADKGCGLWCGGRNKAVDEPYAGTRRLSHHESIVKAKKVHSLSKNYPVIGERFEGELAELPHQPEAKSVDLFDTISFVSSSEDSGVGGDTAAQRPKPKKTGLKCLWCGPSKSQRKTSEESLKAVNVHEQQVQRRNVIKKAETYALSEHYPVAEAYSGEVVSLNKAELAPEANLFDVIDFVPSTEDVAVKRRDSDSVHGGLRCIPCVGKSSKKPIERRPSHHESIVKAKTLHSLSKNYPVIGERFEGELAELPHQPEAKSVDLFDTISFVSSSEDSGVGGDTAAQRPKPKKTGLKCLWCGPSKSQRKTSEESLKAVNVHEQQVQRNRFVRKARTYSTSEHYPAEQVPYEGEVFEIVKANEVPAVNLFDTISFAPSTDEEEQPTAELVHKKKSPKCGLLCAPCLGRRSALPEVDEEPERLVVQHELPSAEEPVAKVEVRPVTPVEVTVTRREVVVETPVVEIEPPVVEYEPPVVVERIERVAKKVEIETVQRPREPSISAGYPVITEPYSGSLHDLQKDYEAPGADLFEHVEFVQPSIEVVDLAVPSTSHEVEEPFVAARTPTPPTERQVAADKGCGLWCGGRNKAVDEPYAGTRRLSHHESIVKAKKVHSLSKNYPVIGERFEGELAELPHQPEAKSVDLFDTISFVSSSEDSGVGGDTAAQRPKPKKTGLKCFWCGPSKSQRKTSEESLKAVNVHEQQVQRRNVIKKAETYALSEHYPVAEAYSGEVVSLNKAELAPEANLFDVIDFVPSTEDVAVKRRDSDSVHGGLRCIPCVGKSSKKPIERRPSHHESIVKAKTLHSLSKNYPVIGERFEGELAELPHQPEAKSVDLFDTISFVSSSEDSGVGGDTAAQRPKPKKTGLKCLWCGPSKSQRKTSEESLKAVNVHEQQVQRNRFVRKARTYSTSEHYPAEQVPYEGEVFEIVKANEVPAVNLFDTISFAPSTDEEEQPTAELVHKKKSPKCGLLCAPCLGRRSALPEVDEEPERLVVQHELPSAEEPVAKVEVRPVTPVEVTVTRREVVVETPVVEIEPPVVEYEPPVVVERIERVVKKVEIETVQRPREPSISAGYPVITEPYSGSLHDLQKDYEAPGADLFEHVEFVQPSIEVVDLAVPSTSHEVEEPFVAARTPTPPTERQVAADKGCGLWCGGRNKAVDEPYAGTRRLSHHESIVKAKKVHSLSKNYPVIGERFEGELAELPHQPEAKSVDLFDTISFVSSSEDSGVGGDTAAQRPKPKKTGLKCLWCGPSKSQRKTSEESLKAVNVHEQQVQRRNVIKKAETYALSEHYPVAEAYSGEVVSLNKAELAPEANLFDVIDFVPSTEDVAVKRRDSDSVHGGLRCIPCVGKSSKKPIERRPSHHESIVKAKTLHSLSKNYPVIGERFEGELAELPHQPEAKSVDLFDTISFVSSSEDSGVGGDTAAQRPKPKKTGLKCLWCGPSKSQRKTSEESLKAVNVHEQQVQRNRFVRKARTYSTSEHYPAEQVPYEGEVFEIVKANEVPAVNLFDTISFAPSTDEEEQPTAELVHKKKSPKCGLLCAPCLGRRSALPEVDEEPERLVVQHELPSAEEPVAKVEVRPVTPVEVTVTRREVVVETPVVEIEPPVVEYEPPVVVERIERVVKKVEIETVQRPREPSISAGYPVITEPYSGSLHDLQKDYEAPGADLFEHVEFVQPSIEVVDLAVPSTSHEVEEPFVAARTPTPPTERQVAADKGCGLWCGGRNKAVDEPYAGTRRLSHHESIVKAKKVHSLSKNYPVIGERFEGELAELPHQPEAKSVDLFDTISFVSSSEDSGVGGDTAAQRPKPKKTGLKCLWCGPSKSQRKTSEESLKAVNVHEQQVQRNRFVRKARTYSTSEHYPAEQVPYEGEVFEIVKANEVPAVNLFDTISFAPSTDEEEQPTAELVHKKKSPKCGLLCAPCLGRRSALPEVDEEPERLVVQHELPSAEEPVAKVEVRPVTPVEVTVTRREVVVETPVVEIEPPVVEYEPPVVVERIERVAKKVEIETVQRPREPSISAGYPVITEPYSGSLHDLQKDYEAPGADLFEHVEFVQPSIEVVDLAVPSTSHEVEEPFVAARTPTPPTERQVAADKGCGLWCGGRNKAVDEPYAGTRRLSHHESIVKAKKVHSLSKNYPVIGERFEGELAELPHQPEAKSVDLFDTISFVSSSEDSGVGGDTAAQRPKPKKTGLKCLWCGPSKSQRKTSEESLKAVNVHEQQVQRRNVIKKAETYALSEHYPVAEAYSGEVVSLNKAELAPEANLFDVIDFVPSTEDVAVKRRYSDSVHGGLRCIPCVGKSSKKPIERRPSHHESIVKAKTLHSLSKNYPVIGERFEGELAELPHQPEAKSVDLFDTISFVSSSEDSGVGGDTAAQRPKPKKTGLKCLWCGPSKSQRKPSEESLKAVNVNEQQVQRRNVIKKAETYALSEHYPVAEAYSGEVVSLNKAELAPEANLFDLIEFVPSSIKATTTSSTDNVQGGFRCIPCVGKTPRDLTDRQILFNQTAGYPAISEPYTGDVDVLTPNVEASSADLFDCVEFAPSDEVFAQSGYNKDTLKSKTSTLEKESGTVRRLRLFTKSRAKPDVFTTSGSYPEYFVYEGPVEDVKRTNDFETTPLRQSVDVYHSGKPFVMSKFTRERLPGIEEIGEPTGSYAVCEIREGETVPLHAFASLDTVPLAEHAKRPVVSQSEKIPSGKFKRKYSKTRNIADADADSSSQSSDELPKSSFKQKREEGEGFFTFFRNRIGTRPQKKTGFEGLMVPDDTNVRSTVLEGDLPSTSIHEHVHVYHHGYSNVHQTIDSGFEDGPNASETDVKRGGTLTWRQSGRFFDKFKRGTKRPSADEAEKPESVIEVKTPPIQTHYEHLEQTPYLGLYSSTERNVDMDPIPLSTAVEHIPIGHYPGHAPVPVEFVTPTQKSAAIEHQQPSTSAKSTFVKRFSRDSRQDRDPHYAYGLSSAKFEGDHSIVNKDSDTPEHPIGEYVTVYHCGKSDVPTTPVPAEFYEVSPERTVSTQYPNSTPTSEFESIAETNVTLERSPVAAYGQVVITDSDRTEAAMTSYSIENVYEDAITSTPRADELSAEPLREQTIVYHSGRSSSRDASERNALVADTSADRERRDLVHRLLALFRRNPRILEGYPEITAVCTYEGPLAEFTRSDDLDQHDLHSLANVYHSGFSDDKASKKARKNAEKQRRRALKKLKVNLNDYPHDDEPIDDAHVFNLYAIRDVPQSPAPATLPADTFYSRRSHPRHRFLRRFRRSRQPRASELAIALRDAPSRRDDYSTATFSMVISDKSLFTRGHWPVTDIDVDVVLTKQRHIDCEFETTVATKRAYDSAIAGGPALSRTSGSQESGAGSSANWCRVRQHPDGSWFAEVSATLSAVPQQKEESVDEAIEVARGAYVITEEPSFDYDVDLCSLVDIDDEVVSKPGEGKSSDCGLSSKFGDSLTRLSLASDDDDNIMFSAITRRLSEKLSKKNKKEEDKRRKKEEKEAAKRAKKDKKAVAAGATKKRTSGGGDADSVSSSSSSSDSDAEHEERHVVVSQAVAGPVEPLSRNQELGDLHGIPESRQITMAPQTAAVNHVDANSSGPYTPAKDKDGRVLREETVEQVYRISGSGKVPKFDPTDMSLQAAVDKCVRETDKVPRVQMVEANILVKENEPLPQALREGSAPHTTVHTWHETEAGPEKVTTEVDKYGNKVTRTVKTQHTKHTIQKQSYQTYAVDGNGTPVPEQQTVIETTEETSPLGSDAVARSPVVHTKTRTVAYEKGSQNEPAEPHGELVSSKTITTGNRTVEILTYKTEKDGVIETRVEHRVTIHSGSDIDHDAELAKALLEATEMSPDLLINRVEVEKSTQN